MDPRDGDAIIVHNPGSRVTMVFCRGRGAAGTMKSHTEHLTLKIPQRMDFLNITPQVEQAVRKSGVREGLCLVNTWQN